MISKSWRNYHFLDLFFSGRIQDPFLDQNEIDPVHRTFSCTVFDVFLNFAFAFVLDLLGRIILTSLIVFTFFDKFLQLNLHINAYYAILCRNAFIEFFFKEWYNIPIYLGMLWRKLKKLESWDPTNWVCKLSG